MSETKNNLELLRILIDKWKHHDALCYQRLNTFWLIQSIIIGIAVIIIRAGIIPENLLIVGGFALLAAFMGYVMGAMAKIDRRVRNTYNDTIVQLLKPHTNLSKISEDEWQRAISDWKPDNFKNLINYWHTPEPAKLGENGMASAWAARCYTGMMYIGVVMCLGFWIGAAILWLL